MLHHSSAHTKHELKKTKGTRIAYLRSSVFLHQRHEHTSPCCRWKQGYFMAVCTHSKGTPPFAVIKKYTNIWLSFGVWKCYASHNAFSRCPWDQSLTHWMRILWYFPVGQGPRFQKYRPMRQRAGCRSKNSLRKMVFWTPPSVIHMAFDRLHL